MVRYAAAVVLGLAFGASPLHAQDKVFTIAAAKTNVHAGPSTGSQVLGTVDKGNTYEITREVGSWVRIAWPAAPTGGYLHVTWGKVDQVVPASESTNTVSANTSRLNAEPAAPAPRATREPIASSFSTPVDLQTSPTRPRSTGSAVAVPSHVIGLGGRMSASSIGYAASARMWATKAVGIQLELGRSTQTDASAVARLRTTTIGSSVVYSVPNLVSDAVWVRPYAGGGASYYRSTFSVAPGVAGAANTGLGYQVFGGGEFTWAGLPMLSVSADVRREWAPTPLAGFDARGVSLGLSAHWYVR